MMRSQNGKDEFSLPSQAILLDAIN
jgi:hypothetical protein